MGTIFLDVIIGHFELRGMTLCPALCSSFCLLITLPIEENKDVTVTVIPDQETFFTQIFQQGKPAYFDISVRNLRQPGFIIDAAYQGGFCSSSL